MTLSMEEASQVVSAPAVVAPLEQLRSELATLHAGEPQRAQLAHHGVNLVEEGLKLLASLGHNFHLERHALREVEEFPKMIYRDSAGSTETQVVEGQSEFDDAMKEGWRASPAPEAPAQAPQGWER